MYLSPPRHHERRTDEADLTPVECDESHTKARNSPEELVDNEVFCRVEVRFVSCSTICPSREKRCTHSVRSSIPTRKRTSQRIKAWYKCPQKCAGHHIDKELIAADTGRSIIVLCMEGIEESAAHEILRPDHARRLDQSVQQRPARSKPVRVVARMRSISNTGPKLMP